MDSIYKIGYTRAARRDLERIIEYLSGFNNPSIISTFHENIERKIETIKFQPYVHMVVIERHEYKFRKFIVKGYIFIYFIDEENKFIQIFRIFHELEDYENKIGRE